MSEDKKSYRSIKDTLFATKKKHAGTSHRGIIPSIDDEDIHSDFHSNADSHSSHNSHSDVNPFKRYMSPHPTRDIIKNEQVYVDTRDTSSFWIVSIVTIILSGVVAFIVTKAANRNGVVQVLLIHYKYVCGDYNYVLLFVDHLHLLQATVYMVYVRHAHVEML